MFNNLTNKLSGIFDKLKSRGVLSEADINAAMREIRIALLEADVALSVVKDFIERVKEKSLGQEVVKSIKPGQQIVKIVHDELVEMLGREAEPINLATTPPVVIMMVGLQGSGKTTSTAKIAKFITEKKRKKVLMVSLDIYRPAAQEQLSQLGQTVEVETLEIVKDQKPLEITKRALQKAKLEGFDVVMLDTAGRLQIDEALMQELKDVQAIAKPHEKILVIDAMAGQEAVNVADTFNKELGLTGIMLTRVDGDARGGAILSVRAVTGCPIKFMGVGEQVDKLEEFDPDRIANRILDMGDVVALVEKATEVFDQEETDKLTKRMEKGQFDLNDMEQQLLQMTKMGGLSGIMGMMPGMNKFKDKINAAGMDDKVIARQVAVIRSMTKRERKYPQLLNASRRKRIAAGSGTVVQDVNKLMKQFAEMQKMLKKFNKLGMSGLKRHGLRGLFQ